MQMATMDSLDLVIKNHALSNDATTSDSTLLRSVTMSVCPIRTTMGMLISATAVVMTKDPIASLAGFVSTFPSFRRPIVITMARAHMSMAHPPLVITTSRRSFESDANFASSKNQSPEYDCHARMCRCPAAGGRFCRDVAETHHCGQNGSAQQGAAGIITSVMSRPQRLGCGRK